MATRQYQLENGEGVDDNTTYELQMESGEGIDELSGGGPPVGGGGSPLPAMYFFGS